jgi:hypothetical protein
MVCILMCIFELLSIQDSLSNSIQDVVVWQGARFQVLRIWHWNISARYSLHRCIQVVKGFA